MNKLLLISLLSLILMGCSGIVSSDNNGSAQKDSTAVNNSSEITIGRFIIIPFEQIEKKTGL